MAGNATEDQIPAIAFIFEPALVVSLLIFGCVLNYRSPTQIRAVNATLPPPLTNGYHSSSSARRSSSGTTSSSRSSSPSQPLAPNGAGDQDSALGPAKIPIKFFWTYVMVPDNSRFRMAFFSRVVAMVPFLIECEYWALTYIVYQTSRACMALTLGEGVKDLAEEHGRAIFALEQALHIDVEKTIQGWILDSPGWRWFANKVYSMVHIPATILFIGYSYHSFPHLTFQAVRRTLVLSNLIAFIIIFAWPCMPPRMLPFEEYGFVDTLHTGKAFSVWTTNKFQFPYGAVPSLHFGYSFIIGSSLFLYSPHRVIRFFAPGYPVLILFVIIATANHYILDAVAGFLVVCVAYRFNRVLLNLRPLEEWVMWCIRTEKPMGKHVFDQVRQGLLDGVGTPSKSEEHV